MPTFVFDRDTGKLVEASEFYTKKYQKIQRSRNHSMGFMYNSDQMEPTRHMASGRYFTSKKKFRDETRAYGCVEVGNDYVPKARKPAKLDRRKRREDIRKAIHDIKNGNVPKMA
jgi:hypothetical protein